METNTLSAALPDVARDPVGETLDSLEWVGMSGIEMPVLVPAEDGVFRQAAKVDAWVSLDKAPSRGIHMSRLFLAVQEMLAKEAVSSSVLSALLDSFLASHEDLSHSARIRVHLSWPVSRPALLSSSVSWRTYPVILTAQSLRGKRSFEVETVVTYSSTCPASAALSRQLNQQGFRDDFSGREPSFEAVESWLGTSRGMRATPHAQRSLARVRAETREMKVVELIDAIEEALQTPVQGAVKREDEQEFARRNGENLMFCEDAARRIKKALTSEADILSFRAEIEHIESLHPHSAIAVITSNALE